MTQRIATVTVVAALRDDYLDAPLPTRLSPRHPHRDEIIRRHATAVAAGVPSYRDPVSGLSVFTARFLADRGWCCQSGCRHCPYVQPGSGG